MTTSTSPGAPPGKRLWLLALVLTCCLTVYLIVAPFLYHRMAVAWPLVTIAALADAGAVGTLVLTWLLHRREVAEVDSLERLTEQTERQLSERAERQVAELRQREQHLLRQCADLQERLTAGSQLVHQALENLVTAQLPAALDGAPVPAAPASGIDGGLGQLMDRAVATAARSAERQESMRTALVALSRRVQTSAHRIQEEATLMADRHPGDPDVLDVSMRVDHAAAQQARHAQSMAVLCGEWPGQQWLEPLPLVDVVRAAAGRIIGYQRIEVAGDPDIAATAPVVEPLIHLVAELLANATQSAPPTTMVPVTIRSVQRGAVIEIHDCGVGLDEHRLENAREIASGERVVGLDELGEFPQTGLAVVGQYVRHHGFRVDVSESVYGGVRAVVGVPAEVVEIVEPAETTVVAAGTLRSPEPAGAYAAITPAPRAAMDDSGLPRRRSRRHALEDSPAGLAEPQAPAARPAPAVADQPPPPTPEEAGAWMGAFLNAPRPAGTDDAADVHDARHSQADERERP
jgi:signal transduction histidine kinase